MAANSRYLNQEDGMSNTISPAPPSTIGRRLHPIVFISGSMSVNKLPASAVNKIDSIMSRNCAIVIGDSKGVDMAVQTYLADKKYDNVTVYFAGTAIRNNVGNWRTKGITGGANENGSDLYVLKDRAMARDADCGLMIWDGLSIKTLNNIKDMKTRNKRFEVVLDDTIFDEDIIDIIINMQTNR
jgi:hypothetical protein